MNVAIIAPTKFLETFCGQSPIQMALAHKVLEDPEYRRFYAEVRKRSFVVMDNSLMELGDAMDQEALIAAATLISPHEVIIPDSFRDGPGTIERFLAADSDVRLLAVWASNLVVAHGQNRSEWIKCFDFFNSHPAAHTIGLPKVLDEIWEPGGRLGATAFLEATGRVRSDKQYHLLGIWTDPIEILLQSRHKWIRSVDTALPIHAGIAGVEFKPTGLVVDRPKRPHRYFPIEDLHHPFLVEQNIRTLERWAEGNHSQRGGFVE